MNILSVSDEKQRAINSRHVNIAKEEERECVCKPQEEKITRKGDGGGVIEEEREGQVEETGPSIGISIKSRYFTREKDHSHAPTFNSPVKLFFFYHFSTCNILI